MIIEITLLNEAGYTQALAGLALNKKQPVEKMVKVAENLCDKDGGHNKFLEHIDTWWMIKTSMYMWKQIDTYRLASKQSESTMHTLVEELKKVTNMKEWINNNFCEHTRFESVVEYLKYCQEHDYDLQTTQANLPMGFLQKRECKFSYKTLRNIINQRKTHKLKEWRLFCESVIGQVKHPELLGQK